MTESSRKALTGLGFDTDLIDKIAAKSLTLSGLRGINHEALLNIGFSGAETTLIRNKINRQLIPVETINHLIAKSGGVCCYCADGNAIRPYQIHHIEEYAVSQNHDEANLMLVCPTHHMNIHAKRIPVAEQLAKKLIWQNLWSVALNYQSRGIPFPFGAFEYIDYELPGDITEIFSFSPPKPSVCIELSKGSLLDDALNILHREHHLILSGKPGSGKTTTATGIAGSLPGYQVFSYTTSDKSSIETATELLNFIEIAQGQQVIIVDDANTRLKAQQIEKVLKAASATKKTIIVNTRATLSSQQDFEQKFPNAVIPISWASVQGFVKANLIRNEGVIVGYLRSHQLDQLFSERIGYSVFERRLTHVLELYSQGTETVWQFIFMLASGELKMHSIRGELFARDRLDLLVLLIGIKQISKVEQGTAFEDLMTLYMFHSKLNKQPPPTAEWLQGVLNDLIQSRIVINHRGRYNLTHRLFAVSFVETCYLRSPDDTAEILDTVFNDRSAVREMLILWSWLQDVQARFYVQKWRQKLNISDWVDIGNSAANESLFSLTLLCSHLHPSNEAILHEILKDKAGRIAAYMNQAADRSLYDFAELSTSIRYNCPEIWNELLSEMDKVIFTNRIKASEPWQFQRLKMLFYSISETTPEWLMELQQYFTQADFDHIINKVAQGNVRELSEVIDFQRAYIHNIKKSQLLAYGHKIAQLISGCPLEKLSFTHFFEGFWDLMAYPKEIDRMFVGLDIHQLSDELTVATPQHWESLAAISHLALYGTKPVIQDLLELIDTARLVENISKYYMDNGHEFRVFIYQLNFAAQNKKTEFAVALQPLVENIVSIDTGTRQIRHGDVLEALSFLDEAIAEQVAEAKGVLLANVKQLHEPPVDYQKLMVDVEASEATGEDYEVYAYKLKIEP